MQSNVRRTKYHFRKPVTCFRCSWADSCYGNKSLIIAWLFLFSHLRNTLLPIWTAALERSCNSTWSGRSGFKEFVIFHNNPKIRKFNQKNASNECTAEKKTSYHRLVQQQMLMTLFLIGRREKMKKPLNLYNVVIRIFPFSGVAPVLWSLSKKPLNFSIFLYLAKHVWQDKWLFLAYT